MIKSFSNNLDITFVEEVQSLNEYKELDFYYIIESFSYVMSGQRDLFDCWIYKVDKRWCVGFWISGNYLLNSKNLITEDIKVIKNKINFSNYKIDGFHFSGNTELIEQLSKNNLDFSLENFKERYFYSLNTIKFKSKFNNEVSFLDEKDIEIVAKFYQQYYFEEYNGNNNKDFKTVIENVKKLKSRNLIYNLKINNKIVGFCTIMSFQSKTSNMIGTIFIEQSFRYKGNGKHLLSNITEKLLKNNNAVFLMTTKENTESNKMVENVGYLKKHEHSDRIIKNYHQHLEFHSS
jgi:predicted GNAT family acetyltransferase